MALAREKSLPALAPRLVPLGRTLKARRRSVSLRLRRKSLTASSEDVMTWIERKRPCRDSCKNTSVRKTVRPSPTMRKH